MSPHFLNLSEFLKKSKKDYFLSWQEAVEKSSLNFNHLSDDGKLLTKTLSKIYDDIVLSLEKEESKLHSQRIVEVGKEIGFVNSKVGTDLEVVLDIVILFKNHLWRHMRKHQKELTLTTDEFFEIEKRINLYLDHILGSIAFAYIATKEQAVIEWVEKMIN